MSEIFDVEGFQHEDVVVFSKGAELVYANSISGPGVAAHDDCAFTILLIRPKAIILGCGSSEATWIASKRRNRDHIKTVTRNEVQIFPLPECPFKAGDRVQARIRGLFLPFTIGGIEPVLNGTDWTLHDADNAPDGIGSHALASSCELAPPEPSIEDRLADIVSQATAGNAAYPHIVARAILKDLDVTRKGE